MLRYALTLKCSATDIHFPSVCLLNILLLTCAVTWFKWYKTLIQQ